MGPIYSNGIFCRKSTFAIRFVFRLFLTQIWWDNPVQDDGPSISESERPLTLSKRNLKNLRKGRNRKPRKKSTNPRKTSRIKSEGASTPKTGEVVLGSI